MTQYKHLFSKVQIGNIELKNRIASTAHQTSHVVDGIPTDDMVAYHEARAKGGTGLIILEAAAVHPSGMLTTDTIAGYDDRVVEGYKKIADTVHQYDTKVIAQLFHGGRVVVSSTYRSAAWAPSAVPTFRIGAMPKPMSIEEIEEVVEGFAKSAKLAKEAGLDGVEICCSHGYLPSQFWSSETNKRTDKYGGSFENRMRFVIEIFERVWEEVGEDFTVGIRLSSDEMTMDGLKLVDAEKICEYIAEKVRLDYISVVAGSASTYNGSTHIVPPSPTKHAYLSNHAFQIRMATGIPTLVTGRIIDPVDAEKIIGTGKADVVGMTRALITDPEMPNKAQTGNHNLINACLGCIQACIGHYHKGLPVGCVQNPMAGRELELKALVDEQSRKKNVLVIGAGPAGLQAAITADKKGHDVTLVDQSDTIGGLLNMVRRAPMRKEVAETMIDNYTRQLETTNVQLKLGETMDVEKVKEMNPDSVIVATGARPYKPYVEGSDHPNVFTVDDIFNNQATIDGENVLVFDFDGEWAAMESAIHLAENGKNVTLISVKLHIGQEIHQFLRNEYMKKLYEVNVKMECHKDFGGIQDGKVLVRNLFSHEIEEIENWDAVVLSYGRIPNLELYEQVKHIVPEVYQIGDCLTSRTIEEATTEGLVTALKL